jgi:hypothetical protein
MADEYLPPLLTEKQHQRLREVLDLSIEGDGSIEVSRQPGTQRYKILDKRARRTSRSTPFAEEPFFPVLVVEPDSGGGANGNATTVATWAYDIYRIDDTDHENKLNETPLQPENSPARIIEGRVTRATDDSVGMAYRDSNGAVKLYNCKETRVKKQCT